MNDIAVGRHADGLSEYAREMESAASRDARERGNLYRLTQMGNDIILQPMEHFFAQVASRAAFARRAVACDQSVNKATCKLAPKQRSIWVTVRTLQHQGAGKIEQPLIVARQTLDQLRFMR